MPKHSSETVKKKNPAAVALSKLGASKGGTARAKILSATKRSQIARLAAKARWAKEDNLSKEIPVMRTYFAYGSNLNAKRFKDRISSVKFKSLATLLGYRLVFEKLSTSDGSGKATIVPDKKAVVEGAIFTYDDKDHEALKKFEGGYTESPVTVVNNSGKTNVQTFIAIVRVRTLKPFDWYVQHILVGGRNLGLPEKYLEMLATVPTKKDTDAKRVADEQAFLK